MLEHSVDMGPSIADRSLRRGQRKRLWLMIGACLLALNIVGIPPLSAAEELLPPSPPDRGRGKGEGASAQVSSQEPAKDKSKLEELRSRYFRRLPGERPELTEEEIGDIERSNFLPIIDRWRIGYTGAWWDPYNQNVLKGDYPILGQNVFFSFTGTSDTLFEVRNLPTPQGTSRQTPGGPGGFFGVGNQFFINQNWITSFELFKGSTAFRPRDWAIRATPVFNVNYLDTQERGVVNIDPRKGTTRFDSQVAFQELFVEKKLVDVSRNFDFISTRLGIQGFTSDFRGFIFSDNEPAARLFGTFDNNRYQWNIAYFYFLEKDTNSMLNTVFRGRHRQVVVANIYKQDFLVNGYTAQLSFHYNLDQAGSQDPGGFFYDTNGFLVRPARIGSVRPHNQDTYYLGWTGEGHIGRVNVSHAFYQVLGHDDFDPLAGQSVNVNAQMAALELSYDIDWLRPKISVFYGSGDKDPTDGTAGGFDSILDNVNFAGAGFSFFNRQGIPLTQTGVFITNRLSLLSDLRSSKIQGQAEYVNPGLFLVNGGVDAELTPKLKMLINFNYLWFVQTQPLQVTLHQPDIRHAIGLDSSIGFIYRPFLNNNALISAGFAGFTPGGGFKDIQISQTLYQAFLSATLTF